mmetsp:Transcript_21867/g.45510  ORF Transcript_21867/g.45510 Transcript_21867/m.45510 type:complete len:298 (+) Transcript_21867:61-954(+)
MQRNNPNKESVKDILSRISQDEQTATAVVEEVRNILVRDLQAAGAGRGVPLSSATTRQPNIAQNSEENTNGVVGIDTSASVSTKPQNDNIDGENGIRKRQKEEDQEELAFTIEKGSETYKNIYSMVQWYRDSYIVGTEFADQRSAQQEGDVNGTTTRQNEKKGSMQPSIHRHQTFSFRGSYFEDNRLSQQNQNQASNNIPLSKFTGLGYPYLVSYAQGYIPSQDVVKLLRPSAMWLVSRDGPLLPVATRSMAQTIPLAQSSLDWVMRENLLWVLKNEEWKDFAKGITTKYVQSYKDD